MHVTMTEEEFNDKRDSETASNIFGKPFMLVYQSGKIDSDAECHLEFARVKIEG